MPAPLPPPTDRDRCVFCGSDARSLTYIDGMATCPECGEGVDRATLAGLEPIKRPYIAALAPALVLLVLYTFFGDYRAFFDNHTDLKLLVHGAATFFIPPLLFMARNQLRWRFMPRGRRRLITEGILFWLLCGLIIMVFAINWSFVTAQLRLWLGKP